MAILTRVRSHAPIAMVAAWLAMLPWPLAGEQRASSAEDEIKATFLFNFTKFIEWPARRSGSFRLCTVAEPPFNAAVDRTLEGETVEGRPIVRVSPATPDGARSCQILFLGRQENDRAERWIAAVRGAPVLIVSESRAAWDRGAQINFVVDDNRVKFDVNTDAASRARLTVSSKLLRVARRVTARRAP